MMLGLNAATASPDISTRTQPEVIALVSSSSESRGGSSSSYTSSSDSGDEATSNRSGSGDDATDAATDSGSGGHCSGGGVDGFDCCGGGGCSHCLGHGRCRSVSTFGTSAEPASGSRLALPAETAPAADDGPAATASQFTGDYTDESETSAESLPPLSGVHVASSSWRLGPVLALLLLALPLGGLIYGGGYLTSQVSGPAAQLLSSLQHSSLAAAKFGCIRAGQSGISAAAAAPILTLRHTAGATSRSVSAIGNAARTLLRGLKPKAKPNWAAPRSRIARLASRMLSGRSDASVAAPGGSAMPEGAGVNAKHLRPSPERGASPAASAKVAATGSSPAAGSDTRSMSAAVVQLQQQVAALHDEVAALRGSLAGFPGNTAAEEGSPDAEDRAAALLRAVDSLTAAVASRQGLLAEVAVQHSSVNVPGFRAGRGVWAAATNAFSNVAGRIAGRHRA
jgi:hypothetical protein